jgi:cell division protein FtsW (lipid II flippase)
VDFVLFWSLVAALLVSLFLCVAQPLVANRGGSLRSWFVLEAVLFAVLSVLAIAFLAGEDDYRDNGTSRWNVYDNHFLMVAAPTVAIVVAVLAAAAARGSGGWLRRWAGPAGIAAVIVVYAGLYLTTTN